MSINGVITNVKTKGLRETQRIRLCKKYDLVTSEKYEEARSRLKSDIKDAKDAIKKKNKEIKNRDKHIDVLNAEISEYQYLTVMKDVMNSEDLYRCISAAILMRKIHKENNYSRKRINSITAVIDEMINTLPQRPSKEIIKEWREELMSLETKKYRADLKKLFIKELIPSVYNAYADRPIEDKVIMMESGNSPSPSSRHLGQVIESQGKYKVVYKGLKVRQVPMVEFYLNALEFIKELATAKTLFLSTANELISCFDVREETKVIQLWHGVGAFKHVGRSNIDNPHFGKNQEDWEEFDSYRNYYGVTTAGEGQSWIFEEAMNLKPEQILPIGVSRTDLFFDEKIKSEAYAALYKEFPQIKDKKIILYAPTFRGKVNKAKAPDKLDLNEMAAKLSDEYVLLIKHHGLSKDIPEIPNKLKETFAFDMTTEKVLDIDRLLMISDVLITDYSSVAFEYAITERPIVFFTYDLEDYIEQRGLYFDFEKEAPGPLCFDTEDVTEYIANLNERFDRDRLLAFKNKYVDACDGHATDRTIALIEA